jgi:general secretion pathway protein G
MQAKRGFTLVEILIVVVILGILAAIVIPQFTQASTEAKQNSLCSDLQSLRSQIELYKCQHNDTAPALLTFENQMIYCTKLDGTASASKARDAANGFVYGPYLESVPANPFNGKNDLATASAVPPVTVGSDATGWQYDATTGQIWSNDKNSTTDAAGTSVFNSSL